MKTITKKDLIRRIKLRQRQGKRYDFLGFVENMDLTPEVISYFAYYRNGIPVGYDWVNGNESLNALIEETIKK